MTYRMRDGTRLLLALFSGYFLVAIGYRFLREQMVVDRCLSAYHGSFNYSDMSCDLKENHPYVSYKTRHPRDEQNLLLALGCFGAFLLACWQLRTKIKKT